MAWVTLCEGLDQIFWESTSKQCGLVFFYSIGFFSLILGRIQISTDLPCVQLILSPQLCRNIQCSHAQKNSSSLCFWEVFGVLKPSNLQDFKFIFIYWGGAYKWEYRSSIMWTFFSHVSSHTILLFCPCIIWCIVHLQVFLQMPNALNLNWKLPGSLLHTDRTGQWRHDKGNVRLVNVGKKEWKGGRCLLSSEGALGLTGYHSWLKICHCLL